MKTSMIVALVLLCAACTPPAAPPSAPSEPVVSAPGGPDEATAQDACGASGYAAMVGTNIAATTFPTGVRVVAPDTMVTEDFRPDRLNVLVDAQGVITGFRCY